ncbi:venom carboxylesterase-6-like isoform X2 [Cherax quadricarinatus]|uniref:venom carboxylesterase-6-like isoform X2 n=1 Tax=Cherax quadricarinatus TaxID=27406 RepID=UPI00387EA0F8
MEVATRADAALPEDSCLDPSVYITTEEDPVGAGGWTGVRNGSWEPPQCPQLHGNMLLGEEDCLYLNIFTQLRMSRKQPVLVYIHGGGFVSGRAAASPPLALMNRDVVLVVIQYRLGVLGFLSMEDAVMPGNLGLKDQTLALRWVHNNIGNLGGDPNKVTIFGDGAGAASVHYQILSPYTSGLFSRAIMQSGSSLCPSALRTNHAKLAHHLSSVACSKLPVHSTLSRDSWHLLRCLQNKSLNELVVAYTAFHVWATFPVVSVPRVDGDFLPHHPATMLGYGMYEKVDLLIGFAHSQSSLVTKPMYKRDSLQQALQREPYMVSSVILSLDEPMISEHLVNLSLLVHLKDVLSNEDALAQTLNDGLVGVCLEDTALLHSEAHPTAKVFLYQLGYSEQPSLHYTREHFIDDHCAAGVCHLDTLHYIFEGTLGFPFLSNPQDHALANIMVDLWTNFITSGNPTPDYTLGWKWEALAPASFRHLLLSLTPAMSDDTRLQVRHFWHTLPTQHNIILFPNVVDHIRDPQAAKATRERMIHDDMADIHKINASNILAISEESNMANAETAQVSGKSFAEVLQNTGSLTCIIVEDMIIKNTEFFMKVNYSSCFVNKFYVSIEGYEGPSDKYNFLTCDIVRELSNTDCFKKASSNTSCYIFEFYTAKDCDVNDDVKIGEVEEEHCCEGSEVALIGVEEMLVCREKDKTTESGSVKPNAPHSLSKTRLDDTCREYRKRQRGEGSWKKHYEKKLDCDEFSNILEAYIKLKFEKSSYEHLLVSVDEVDYVYAPLKSRLKSPTNW